MQTLSSANFTCIESLSADEWIDTVGILRSFAALRILSATSPLLAIRIFLNNFFIVHLITTKG
ncbi:MAG: hypothetical protein CM15mP81_04620 [Alphaproteobacteria bacterium]|nr:MAG: hypothetical protein CM15mP81_04620 [Alphaproteobacteria bacterium]